MPGPTFTAAPDFFRNVIPAQCLLPQPVCTLAIDAEEDFDWDRPLPGTPYDTQCMQHLGQLQSIAAAYRLRPAYLLTYPVLQDPDCVRELRRYFERGECVLGLQLHTWVTPPFEGPADLAASFAGTNPAALQERKLVNLIAAFRNAFGTSPSTFRSGRYGLGPTTPDLLERHGFEVDVSVAPRTQFRADGGPDYTAAECAPFWFGDRRRLLEVPLCRSVVGWGGRWARDAYVHLALRANAPAPGRRRPVLSALTRLHAAERVTLSPEGNDPNAARRLVGHLLARGQRVLTVSFHSSSLRPGRAPYVRSARDLHAFYDRLSAMLSHLADSAGCRFCDLEALPALMAPPPPAGEVASRPA